MIITLKQNAAAEEVSRLRSELEAQGFVIHPVEGTRYNILGLIGDTASLDARQIESLDFVDKVTRIQEPYKKANRKFHPDDSVINVGGALIGGGHFAVMAGPCSVETPEQVLATAKACKEAGATILRGGAFKPRFTLLKEVGKLNKPVLLKRGLSATYEEWLMAAEYIMSEGNEQIVLCERGIRTFETKTRNTLDVTAIPMMHELSHLPIIMDPSHAAGMSRMVRPLSLASVGGGADGLMIEVHNDPAKALCDGPQALRPDQFTSLMKEINALRQALVECTK
ncbi:MAG: 3-deoxy-7-phosphoheptulonate synthase [Veillonella sp.]|nr:3-deoxy-7-phosphoheptulonate synthase [Veillonella sp.]